MNGILPVKAVTVSTVSIPVVVNHAPAALTADLRAFEPVVGSVRIYYFCPRIRACSVAGLFTSFAAHVSRLAVTGGGVGGCVSGGVVRVGGLGGVG